MRMLFRILILFVVVPATYYFLYWVPFSIIPFVDHRWIPSFVSLICAIGAGWYVWRKIGTMKDSSISDRVLGALVLGGAGFSMGFFGPMIFTPNANQGPMLGIFITGPAGFIIGAVLGLVVGKIRRGGSSSHVSRLILKMWPCVLWSCGIMSVAVIAGVLIYVPWHESKYSNIIERPSDLNKRDSTLNSLRVRSLSDDDLDQLKKFEYLNHLDFYAGWGVAEAKLTDIGLKNLSEMKLSMLEWLMLGSCKKISDEGLKYISHIQTLKYLSLAACPQITDIGLANLATSKSIETIDLRGCAGVSDRGLRHLIKMPKLKEVSLGGCTNITAAGIDDLRRALPNAKIVKDDKEWAMHIM
jgi:hypothetical protein